MAWKAESFLIATSPVPWPVFGYTYNGIGIWKRGKHRGVPIWAVTHLNTGHGVVLIRGERGEAMRLAGRLADLGDWDFLSLEGWRDRFPDLSERVEQFARSNPFAVRRWSDVTDTKQDHDMARIVAGSREG